MTQIPAAQSRARSYFDEGELAFDRDEERDECPYAWDSDAAANWLAGWDSAQYENEQALGAEAIDRKFNDPHRRSV